MSASRVRTSFKASPKIYAYITPEIARHDGWSKIGYTEKDVTERINEQTHTANVKWILEWQANALFEDDSKPFKDHDFHRYLVRNGIERMEGEDNEWFHVVKPKSKDLLNEFRENHGILDDLGVSEYKLRDEQDKAVSTAKDYFELHDHGEFLWNAKPRFGKTLSVYDLCKRINASKVLIVTNRPAIANSWYSDYCTFLGLDSGYYFVSGSSALRDNDLTISREEYEEKLVDDHSAKCVEFMSLQDLKGSIYFGGKFNKLKYVAKENWDLLVIDEAHEGVDTYKTDVAFDHIKRKWTLHLSGTPFKALANEKFPEDAIYNWTYADEQKAKRDWSSSSGLSNPYETLPKLHMFTYQMSKIVEDEVQQGIILDDDVEEYAFNLNDFFATDKTGKFVHDSSVEKFLNALTTQEKFPFSTEELRNELKHTLWILNRVDSAKALYKKLRTHPVFCQYEIILAAGDGKVDDEGDNTKAFNKVTEAIKKHDRTITLSVGQLTTGVTIPEWTAVLMLSNINSAALYMQAAFRAQNPCLFSTKKGEFFRKENSYVFDFDPARTLDIFEKFANDLSSDTSAGKGDMDSRKNHVRELLNFFPVIGEDENGKMIELDAESVLSIPRKIRSIEVVHRGFMSDFLFQNISNIFHAPTQVWELINSLEPVKQPDGYITYSVGELDLVDGEIKVATGKIEGTAVDLFGDKIYGVEQEDVDEMLDQIEAKTSQSKKDEQIKPMMDKFKTSVTSPMLDTAKERFGRDLSASASKALERKINSDVEMYMNKAVTDYQILQNTLDAERDDALRKTIDVSEREEIVKHYEQEKAVKSAEFKKSLDTTLDDLVNNAGQDIVERVLTDQQNQKKKSIEDAVKDHLRGFSRTIPSFLMAYGSEGQITLENFDKIIPADVFKEVTSISLEDFRFLRDGGIYVNEETGEEEHFEGHLFDPVVFNDSVNVFLGLKKKLANYFDESATQDIFDFIPPQRTNQIFTPRKVVIQMVDLLEKENPGCFDDDSKTFADLYMKSGLYLAEIVKRLYRSEKIKANYPNEQERLDHIFSKQIYGLAPTEIIYRIVLSFLLGFSEEVKISKNNIRLCDSLQYSKDGTLDEKLKEVFDL
ncbi:MAG: DEAD/DEAH box helicase family protein [Gudongella sp.]|nr:DEAD/DEAH box helicase family protein [Gudongella sp.]